MSQFSDHDMVAAVQRRDAAVLETMYHSCKDYFFTHASAIFTKDCVLDDVFQESLVHLWREIETHRIEIREGILCRWSDGRPQPMTCSLLTFLLAIAKRKNWEHLRRQQRQIPIAEERTLELLDHDRYVEPVVGPTDAELREQIVADAVLQMTERCRQILTLFYYEHRTLDEILMLRPENKTKQGLKTSKYKCMQRLRQQLHDKLSYFL